jgi:hypothetical protein
VSRSLAQLVAPLVGLVALAGACVEPASPSLASAPPVASGPLVARVGSVGISAAAVAAIAAERRLEPRAALELAVREALFAQAALDAGLGERPAVRAAISAGLARAVLEHARGEAARAPVAPDELRAATDRRWLDLDRAESFRTVHAVVLVSDRDDATRARAARALRDELLRALEGTAARARVSRAPERAGKPWERPLRGDPAVDDFLRETKPFEGRGLKVVSQELPPVTADGWSVAVDSRRFDAEFAACVAKLAHRGELAACDSSFGHHVVLLLERVPEQRVPEVQRLSRLREAIVGERANRLLAPVLVQREATELPANVDALLALIVVDR